MAYLSLLPGFPHQRHSQSSNNFRCSAGGMRFAVCVNVGRDFVSKSGVHLG